MTLRLMQALLLFLLAACGATAGQPTGQRPFTSTQVATLTSTSPEISRPGRTCRGSVYICISVSRLWPERNARCPGFFNRCFARSLSVLRTRHCEKGVHKTAAL